MDHLSKEKRSWNMSKIKSKNTKPEVAVRSYLFSKGLRFRIKTGLPGRPDIVLPKYKAVVFVHGCFWHSHEGCRRSNVPKSNIEYWTAKLERNKQRDADVCAELTEQGWRVFTIWECEYRDTGNLDVLIAKIKNPDIM